MAIASFLETACKRICGFSLLLLVALFFLKDRLPEPDFYDLDALQEPLQEPTFEAEFSTEANGQTYTIVPQFAYRLDGVVVSLHDADQLNDIYHHDYWKDFLNLRDLCVIWGENVRNGVYHRIDVHNDTWTCWYAWKDSETGSLFSKDEISNNHLLADDDAVKTALLNAEPGDHIHLEGLLAEYANPANGFKRGTSTSRTDTGEGACETIYLQDFSIVKKANPKLRRLYTLFKWLAIVAGIGYLVMLPIAPARFKG